MEPDSSSDRTSNGEPAERRKRRRPARRDAGPTLDRPPASPVAIASIDRRLAAVIEGMSEAFLALDPWWRVTYANGEACRLNGLPRQALLGRDHWLQWPETVGTEVERQYRRVCAERVAVRFEHHYPVADVWHEIQAYPAEDGGVAVFYRDVTAAKLAAHERERLLQSERAARAAAEGAVTALAVREARFRALIEHSSDAITVIDPTGTRLYVSPSYERVYGYPAEQQVGGDAFARVHPDDRSALQQTMRALAAASGATVAAGFRVQHADGSWRDISAVAQNRLDDPAVRGLIINSCDVTERLRAERALRESEEHYKHQALHDALTGLANRVLFVDRVEHALARAHRERSGVAVIFVDLDGFKQLNDSHGHLAGDRCLVAAAARLRGAVRLYDTAARLGGDEFAVLIEGTHPSHAEGEAIGVARRITDALREPVDMDGVSCRLAASVGIASDDGSAAPDDLLRRADGAMYAAKARGGDCFAVAEPPAD